MELSGCSYDALNDIPLVERLMVDAVTEGGGTVVDTLLHHFSPHGISGVVVIKESHFAIHTWPEYGYAALDLFTCSPGIVIDTVMDRMTVGLQATDTALKELDRGKDELFSRTAPLQEHDKDE